MMDAENTGKSPVFEAKSITMDFKVSRRGICKKRTTLRALTDLSFAVYPGESVAVVGESGSGKSTLCRLAMRFYVPTAGHMDYCGKNIHRLDRQHLKAFRQKAQMIFQDPFSSLNPLHTVGYHLMRPLQLYQRDLTRENMRDRIDEILELVGLTPVRDTYDKFPHQLSGGQKQRAFLGKVLATGADIIFADEPTSMLDVSIRLGILNLMGRMKTELGKSFLYITHDIATARYFSDRIIVLYNGHMVEWGDVEDVIQSPRHPYTRLLISAAPDPERRPDQEMAYTKGVERTSWTPESRGCPFVPFCGIATPDCESNLMPPRKVEDGHFVRCNNFDSGGPTPVGAHKV